MMMMAGSKWLGLGAVHGWCETSYQQCERWHGRLPDSDTGWDVQAGDILHFCCQPPSSRLRTEEIIEGSWDPMGARLELWPKRVGQALRFRRDGVTAPAVRQLISSQNGRGQSVKFGVASHWMFFHLP